MSHSPTVFVVDDDEPFRTILGRLLKSVGLSVQTYGSGNQFLECYDPEQPGCLLLDVRMPGMSGLELQEKLATGKRPAPPIIFITAHGDLEMVVRCMKAGAVEFLEKPFREQVLLDRVRQSLELDARQRRQWAHHMELQRQLAYLTEREQEVLDSVIVGKSTKQIADELEVSAKAIEAHRSRIMKKMGVRSSIELMHRLVTADG